MSTLIDMYGTGWTLGPIIQLTWLAVVVVLSIIHTLEVTRGK